MPKLSINKAGTWYTAKKFWINVGGTWQLAKKMWINKGGTWQLITFISPTDYDYSSSITDTYTETTWRSDGDTYYNGAPAGTGWLDTIATGVGSDFWIRFTNSTSNATLTGPGTPGFGSWLQMSSNYTIYLTSAPGATTYAAGLYEVSDDAGSSVLVTGAWEMYLNE
jgi:hypothetical protein